MVKSDKYPEHDVIEDNISRETAQKSSTRQMLSTNNIQKYATTVYRYF